MDENEKKTNVASRDQSPTSTSERTESSRTELLLSMPNPSDHSTSTRHHHVHVEEMLHNIETAAPPPAPKRPVLSRIAHSISTHLKIAGEKVAEITTGSKHEVKHEGKLENRFKALIRSARQSIGASQLIRELRAREEEYLHQVEEALTKEKANKYAEDHPYVALRKKIEEMSRTGKEEYKIQYQSLLNHPKVVDTLIPIYSTGYENERKKQARRRQFMFGLGADDRFDPNTQALDPYLYTPNEKPDAMHWGSKHESDIAFLALIFSVSNLFRFPHACYVNGGIIFFLIYCLLVITLVRPLIFFEMLIGQFSWKGEWGFGKLHRYAKGFPHALTFVNLTFVTLNNAVLGYAGLYAIGALYLGPGECHPEWMNFLKCIPYDSLEQSKSQLMEKRIWIQEHFKDDDNGFQNASLFLSTELFFRFYVLNWKGKFTKEFYHWKFVLSFMVVMLIVVPASLQTTLVSTISRIWIYFSCILPILLSLVLFHQYAFRDGYNTPRYFSVFNWGRLGTLTLWRDAFEMAFTTVGVGYGLFIRVAASTDFRYNRINQTSWIISISAIVFNLLCAMVVYTELAILGLIAEAKEFTHIFAEGFGVSFVCLSGAVAKIVPPWGFSICFTGLLLFNIWTMIVATHTTSKYVSHHVIEVKGKKRSQAIGMILTILVQIFLISIYAYQAEYTTTDSFDLYGGAGAACTILLAEIGIAFVLCGFREFMTDIEIMLNKQLSFLYQVQMKYFIPPALLVAMFMITLSWLHSPPTLDNSNTSYETYYFAICINSMPVAIMAGFALQVFRNRNKVVPLIEETKLIEKSRGMELYWKYKSRWIERRAAIAHIPDKQIQANRHTRVFSRASLVTNFAQKLDHLAAQEVYSVHADLKRNLTNLLFHLKSKALWRIWINKIIAKRKIKSLVVLTRFIMRRCETKRIYIETTFLKNLIRQCSVSNLVASSASQFERKSYDNQEMALLNHLINVTDLDLPDDEVKCSVNTASREGLQDQQTISESDSSETTISSTNSRPIYHRIIGKQVITPEEEKLDVVVRIKKALHLPCEKEISNLQRLRSLRFYKETNAPWYSMINPAPEEKFITIKVMKRDQPEEIVLNIRVIILRCSDHFVLSRLPVPRPVVVRITNEQLATLPGADTNRKISNFAIRSLKETLWKTDLTLLGPENRTPLLKHLDQDIYRFIDPVRSCIIILEKAQEVQRLNYKLRWLTKPTRRQRRLDQIPDKLVPIPFEIEETSFANQTRIKKYNDMIDKMIAEPGDIVYHPPDNDVWTPEPLSPPSSVFSSSSSSGYEEPKNQRRQEVVIHRRPRHSEARAQLVDETLMTQQRRILKKNLDSHSSKSQTWTSLSTVQVNHLTNADWKKKRIPEDPVLILHKKPNGLKENVSVKFLDPPLIDGVNGYDEHEVAQSIAKTPVDSKASIRSLWSEDEMKRRMVVSKKADTSDYLLNLATAVSSKTLRDFSNLKNDYEELMYYREGRTLIIEPKDLCDAIITASRDDSIASRSKPSQRSTRTNLKRGGGKTTISE